jgi:hypothetical protein
MVQLHAADADAKMDSRAHLFVASGIPVWVEEDEP